MGTGEDSSMQIWLTRGDVSLREVIPFARMSSATFPWIRENQTFVLRISTFVPMIYGLPIQGAVTEPRSIGNSTYKLHELSVLFPVDVGVADRNGNGVGFIFPINGVACCWNIQLNFLWSIG